MLDDTSSAACDTGLRRAGLARLVSRWSPVLIVVLVALAAPFAGADGATEAGPSDETLRDGAEVYSAVCSSCHQPGGAGLAGSFPPLVDNPNLTDAAYVSDVIVNGLAGEITVNGEVYDGVMPAQSSLSDADVTAVVAYIQSGFAAPAGPAPEVATGPVAGTDLPPFADYTMIAAFAIAIGLGALVLGPRVIAAHDRREVTWLDAWMKTAVIVVGAIVGTVILPAKFLELETVQDLPATARDLLAVGIWSVGLAVLLLALWYAHRERRI
jgi:mono/diheme cytochrome c family protein